MPHRLYAIIWGWPMLLIKHIKPKDVTSVGNFKRNIGQVSDLLDSHTGML